MTMNVPHTVKAIRIIFISLSGLTVSSQPDTHRNDERPANVLFILADDLGYRSSRNG